MTIFEKDPGILLRIPGGPFEGSRGVLLKQPGALLKDPGVLLKDPGVLSTDPGVLLKDPEVLLKDTGVLLKDPREEEPSKTQRSSPDPPSSKG